MDNKQLAAGTILGGLVMWALGYVIFDVVFAGFYAANAGTATGVDRSQQVVWAVMLGSFSYAALLTLALQRRSDSSLIGAVKAGAVVGFLLWATADFIFYGINNVSNLTRTVVDPLLEAVRGGIGAAIIAIALKRLSPPAAASS